MGARKFCGQVKGGPPAERHPSGAKARIDLAALTARLKSCPFKQGIFPQPVQPRKYAFRQFHPKSRLLPSLFGPAHFTTSLLQSLLEIQRYLRRQRARSYIMRAAEVERKLYSAYLSVMLMAVRSRFTL